MIEILENALFIADSHYPHHGDSFLTLLRSFYMFRLQCHLQCQELFHDNYSSVNQAY